MNNADYGMTFQKVICDKYGIYIHGSASEQFRANFNSSYVDEVKNIVPQIFSAIGSEPEKLLTYTKYMSEGNLCTSPHNFLLKSGKTMSIRTMKKSDKVAPRTVGQAGYAVLNEYFGDIYGREIETQEDIKIMVTSHIHEIMPIFIEKLFQSDYTVLINKEDAQNFKIIKADEVASFSFRREDFSFTKELGEWKESTTLKYNGKSIAEIQTHRERTFKFRFIVSNIPEWFEIVKINNETLGMSAECTICEYFDLEKPKSFNTRALRSYVEKLTPVVAEAFENMPRAIKHSGSEKGERGEQSKCSYDFVLEGNKTLSLKTNKGKMVCPPEVGQPGSKTCLFYFEKFFEKDIIEVTSDAFKEMVLNNIAEIMPIYVEHLLDSDWLLWIYENKDKYEHMEISKDNIEDFKWEKDKFSFTKPTIEEWNESNTVKYNDITVGEFQVHRNRNCYKFRFQMYNLLKFLLKKK